MKKNLLLTVVACGTLFIFANKAIAQEAIVVEEDVNVVCKDHVYSDASDDWFIQLGAGINLPMFENSLSSGNTIEWPKHHVTAAYNVGFGKWMTPYLGWRISFLAGSLHWDNVYSKHFKYVNANFDLMWDMFNSLGGVNSSRVFSIVPFVGLGGTFAWNFPKEERSIKKDDKDKRATNWALPVSAGLQLRFRLCSVVDFFAEGRFQFYGDNFNQDVYGKSVDINFTAIGGLSFNIGGRNFKSFNPCSSLAQINDLNAQINALRAELASCGAALAAAEAQLPCPEVQPVVDCPEIESAPMMSTVRFSLNSAKIADREMINIYNVAEWMKANPDAKVVIKGYADAKTGSSEYNMSLSEKRANNVCDVLVNQYGIDADRLTVQAEGSDTQVYDTNNWNRIVIFSAK